MSAPPLGVALSSSTVDNYSADDAPAAIAVGPTPLSLEQLVRVFVDSKRSLRSTDFVMRANLLVSRARFGLERVVTLAAANASQTQRLKVLAANAKATREGLTEFVDGCDREFRNLLARLDEMRGHVENQLQHLRTIALPDVLIPQPEAGASLDRFLDEAGLTELDRDFKDTIDLTNEVLDNMTKINDELDGEVQLLESTLYSGSGRSTTQNAASLYRIIDDHAHSMARHLRELVNHYDHCLLALKNTEGAGEALDQADVPDGLDPAELDRAPEPPKNHDEFTQILGIIVADAAEVEQVVEDIKLRHQVLEDHVDQLDGHVQVLLDQEEKLAVMCSTCSSLDDRLSDCVYNAKTSHARWMQLQDRFSEKMAELDNLREFYGSFFSAYEALLGEMQRRSEARLLTQSIAGRAQTELRKLFKTEINERAAFAAEHGQYLPLELWDQVGGNDTPAEYKIMALRSEAARVVETPIETWQDALKALQSSRLSRR